MTNISSFSNLFIHFFFCYLLRIYTFLLLTKQISHSEVDGVEEFFFYQIYMYIQQYMIV